MSTIISKIPYNTNVLPFSQVEVWQSMQTVTLRYVGQFNYLALHIRWSVCDLRALLLLDLQYLLLPLWESVIVLCFVVRYFISILALQSS